MKITNVKNLGFRYYTSNKKQLNDISFSINQGDFVLLLGRNGSGKSTLLKHLKKELKPYGKNEGSIDIIDSKDIGFLFQDPHMQPVMDKVIEELAFGLENYNMSPIEMQHRIGEIVTYFDLEHLLDRSINTLSGGEKQLVNLCSIIALRPKLLLLDEPLAQLDTTTKNMIIYYMSILNKKYGITIIVSSHLIEDLYPLANKIMFLEKGELLYFDDKKQVAKELLSDNINYHFIKNILNTNEETSILKEVCNNKSLDKKVIEVKNLTYSYEKGKNILEDISVNFNKGNIYGIIGANGSGKSTFLKILAGSLTVKRGVKVSESISLFNQNPNIHFFDDTVIGFLNKIAKVNNKTKQEINNAIEKWGFIEKLDIHPFDLSGGEKQSLLFLAAELREDSILLLDEPTKGLDPIEKERVAKALIKMKKEGKTIIIISHDLDFLYDYIDYASMMFYKNLSEPMETNKFFEDKHFFIPNKLLKKKKGDLL